jgi:hypothetical protein
VGQLESTLGLNGVVWLTAVVIAAVFAWTFRLLIARGANLLAALVLVLLALWASTIHFLARPHVLSWLFTLAWFVILDSSERECFGEPCRTGAGSHAGDGCGRCRLLMLVWVNVHGGFWWGLYCWEFSWRALHGLGSERKTTRIEELLLKIAAREGGCVEFVLGRAAFRPRPAWSIPMVGNCTSTFIPISRIAS